MNKIFLLLILMFFASITYANEQPFRIYTLKDSKELENFNVYLKNTSNEEINIDLTKTFVNLKRYKYKSKSGSRVGRCGSASCGYSSTKTKPVYNWFKLKSQDEVKIGHCVVSGFPEKYESASVSISSTIVYKVESKAKKANLKSEWSSE